VAVKDTDVVFENEDHDKLVEHTPLLMELIKRSTSRLPPLQHPSTTATARPNALLESTSITEQDDDAVMLSQSDVTLRSASVSDQDEATIVLNRPNAPQLLTKMSGHDEIAIVLPSQADVTANVVEEIVSIGVSNQDESAIEFTQSYATVPYTSMPDQDGGTSEPSHSDSSITIVEDHSARGLVFPFMELPAGK
jgi:hypothetical protein